MASEFICTYYKMHLWMIFEKIIHRHITILTYYRSLDFKQHIYLSGLNFKSI